MVQDFPCSLTLHTLEQLVKYTTLNRTKP